MKIAMIGQKGIPAKYGGIERHVEELSLELVKQGYSVTVYAREWYTSRNIKNFEGIKIIHTPTIHTKHLDAITHTFTATVHALFQKPDIIHYHGVGPSLLCWLPRIFAPKIKVIATVHCADRYHQKWGLFARLMLRLGEWTACRFAHETITVSKTLQNYCLNEYRSLTTYIPNGITGQISKAPALIDQWNLETNKYVLMVSRLVKHKGAHYLIDAWQFAKQQNPETLKNYKLVIVGGTSFTDDYVKKLHDMARGDNSVIFTDWQSGQNLSELYANTKLFIHPSENEGMPITVLQAMSYGKAVLVSDIPEHKEVVTDSRFWFANANSISLANKITELINDEQLLKDAGLLNRQITRLKYNWQDIAEKTSDLYLSSKREAVKNYKVA